MSHFFVKTQNPRPTFAQDMSADERAVMQQHVGYWTAIAERGIAVVFGPVLDPAGVYGIGVYRAQDEAHMQAMLDGDPANHLLKYAVFPMRAVVGTPASE